MIFMHDIWQNITVFQGATGFAGAGIKLEAKLERPVMQA